MSTSQILDQFIADNGGNARDALPGRLVLLACEFRSYLGNMPLTCRPKHRRPMNNCVSYQVALQLKAAGFPEPHQLMSSDVEVWAYNPNISCQDAVIAPLPLFEPHIFAPTISDLLPLMDADVFYSKGYKLFCVDMRHTGDEFVKSNNIHDAAALAWLHQNQR